MKLLYFLFWCSCSLIFACTTPAQKKADQAQNALQDLIESKYWPLDTNYFRKQKKDVYAYEHLGNIGDCFVFTIDKKNYGIMLYEISKSVEGITYNFLVQPNDYTSIRNFDLFKTNPFVGHAIPNGIIKKREVGFMLHGFMDKDFIKIFPKLKLIGHTDLSAQEERIGGQSVPSTLIDLRDEINDYTKSLSETKNRSFLDDPQDTVFNFAVLKTALGTDIKKPYSYWMLTKETANPMATKLMPEDYWWDEGNDFAPFGNDDGSDALHGFREWRLEHFQNEPSDYFNDLAKSWETSFEQKDWTDYAKIKKRKDDEIQYTGIDYAIIGTAFAQLVLEGKISPQLKMYAIKSINRQKLLAQKGDYNYTLPLLKERLATWEKQLAVLEKAP